MILVHIPFGFGGLRPRLILRNHISIPRRRLARSKSDQRSINGNKNGKTNEKRGDDSGRRSKFNTLSLSLFGNNINLLQIIHFLYENIKYPCQKNGMTLPSSKISFLSRILTAPIIMSISMDYFFCKEYFT